VTKTITIDIKDEYIEDDKYVYSRVSSFRLDAYARIYGKIEQVEEGS
jgi:hypothetical protein